MKSGYNWLVNSHPKVDWDTWVWNRLNIPKHKFICWLIMWKRIRVKARLKHVGVIDDASCPLCDVADETVDHLYFACPYSQKCLTELVTYTGIRLLPSSVEDGNTQMLMIKGRFRRAVIQCNYAALLYVIWQQRNDAVWHGKVCRPDECVNQFFMQDVYHRICYVMP